LNKETCGSISEALLDFASKKRGNPREEKKTITETMLGAVIALLIVTLYILLRKPSESSDVEVALTKAMREVGIDESLGTIKTLAAEINRNQQSFDKMLSSPTQRGTFGELSLESILSDQLPPDLYGIRKRTLDGKIPDAHIKSTVGIICIDSKFPLTNYRKMIEGAHAEIREDFKKQFIKDVEGHLVKIAEDYVCPERDSAEFAFAYIPSESIYWFLVTEAYELLRDYTGHGVQVVSPLTLAHKIELIKAGAHARKLSEEAGRIQKDIRKLASHFKTVRGLWSTLYDTHLKNLRGKATEFDKSWKKLEEEFDRIENLAD
jgi:DNA recombination protein RmuC